MRLIKLRKGNLSKKQIDLLLLNLPFDLTFVDEKDIIRYYSGRKKLIFPRQPGIIGTKVQNCHSLKSVPAVDKMIREFQKGRQDVASFWIKKEGQFIYVRYIAVRDAKGRYKGVLEVTEDATRVRRLKGQMNKPVWGEGERS